MNQPLELPERIRSVEELEEVLTSPRPPLLDAVKQLTSPLLVLGASGKMGPTLCVLARRAAESAGHKLRVVAVSRFSDRRAQQWLEAHGVETIPCDLLDRTAVARLPESRNLIYLVGLKFGTAQNPSLTWAINTLVPAYITEHYPAARIVALSTGNVYPLLPARSGGAAEEEPPAPVGEYGSAALARERLFEYCSRKFGTAMTLLRLNYAVEMRYGVLIDIATRVWNSQPVDVSTGFLNCIWQGDANDMILRSFELASSPPSVLNLTGPAVLSVRELAERFGRLLQRPPRIQGSEADTALLSNPARLCARLGQPAMPLDRILEWTAHWVRHNGATLGKPTHFEVRSGRF